MVFHYRFPGWRPWIKPQTAKLSQLRRARTDPFAGAVRRGLPERGIALVESTSAMRYRFICRLRRRFRRCWDGTIFDADTVYHNGRVICEHLGISKMTRRQAYGVLARKGCIEAQRGSGRFAGPAHREIDLRDAELFGRSEGALDARLLPRLISLTTTPVSHDAQRFFRMREGEDVYEMTRFCDSAMRWPAANRGGSLPQRLFPGIERFQWATESLKASWIGTRSEGCRVAALRSWRPRRIRIRRSS